MDPDDRPLLAAWRADDLEARDRLFARHVDRVRAFLFRLGDPDYLDHAQDTFVVAARSIDKIEGDDFRAYALGVARNVFYDAVRKQTRRRGIFSRSALDSTPEDASFLADYRLESEHQRLMLAIDALPEAQQAVIRRLYLDGRTVEQIATELERSPSAIRNLHKRGLAYLKTWLGEAEGVHRGDEIVVPSVSLEDRLDQLGVALRAMFF